MFLQKNYTQNRRDLPCQKVKKTSEQSKEDVSLKTKNTAVSGGELKVQVQPTTVSVTFGTTKGCHVSCDVRFPPHPGMWQFCPPNPSGHSQIYSNLV